jgi:hypothetical protein
MTLQLSRVALFLRRQVGCFLKFYAKANRSFHLCRMVDYGERIKNRILGYPKYLQKIGNEFLDLEMRLTHKFG